MGVPSPPQAPIFLTRKLMGLQARRRRIFFFPPKRAPPGPQIASPPQAPISNQKANGDPKPAAGARFFHQKANGITSPSQAPIFFHQRRTPPGPREAARAPPRRAPPGRKEEEDKRDDVCLPRSSQHAHDLKCIRVSGNPSLRLKESCRLPRNPKEARGLLRTPQESERIMAIPKEP